MTNVILEIAEIRDITHDTRCIYFRVPAGFTYRAGQYITLLLQINGREVRRPYSLSSSPDTDPLPFITVKLIENGEASRYLHTSVKTGDLIKALQPGGRFILPENPEQQFIFLAAGSGISPVFGLIKTLLHASGAKITLIYSNRNKEEVIFYEELLSFEKKYAERFNVIWLFSQNKNLAFARLNRHLLEDLLEQYHILPGRDVVFYTCGPFPYMEMIAITLITAGFTQEQILRETFTPFEEEEDEDGSLLKQEAPPEYCESEITLNLYGNEFHFIAGKEESILQAALRSKIDLPYSCRRGMCSTCILQLNAGQVHMHYNQVLTEKEIEAGRVLTCTGHALTPALHISTS